MQKIKSFRDLVSPIEGTVNNPNLLVGRHHSGTMCSPTGETVMKSMRGVVLAIATLAVAGAVQASAAVAVIGGGGLAKSCYRAAESGREARSGLEDCNLALEQEALTPH